jgi:hypothetical protein
MKPPIKAALSVSPKPLAELEPSFVETLLGCSSTFYTIFVFPSEIQHGC